MVLWLDKVHAFGCPAMKARVNGPERLTMRAPAADQTITLTLNKDTTRVLAHLSTQIFVNKLPFEEIAHLVVIMSCCHHEDTQAHFHRFNAYLDAEELSDGAQAMVVLLDRLGAAARRLS